MRRPLLAFALFAACDAGPPIPEVDWKEFVAPDRSWSVWMPGTPAPVEQRLHGLSVQKYVLHRHREGIEFVAAQADLPVGGASLAVVAPGIAEALFATALGLLAAIPAVIFYNKFNSEVARHAARLEGFADEFGAILSRQIDKTM